MFYFLVFLAPFVLVMGYLIRENAQLRKRYVRLYERIWRLSATAQTEARMKGIADLDNIVTDGTIKIMEMDLIDIEAKLGIKKALVISNKFGPKLMKLNNIARRIETAEKQVKQLA